jgi:hypothetical protein
VTPTPLSLPISLTNLAAVQPAVAQHPWHYHAASPLESLHSEQWNVVVVTSSHIYQALAKLSDITNYKKIEKIDSKQSGTNRAAHTINDCWWLHWWTPNRDWDKVWQQIGQLALSISRLWLHQWTLGGTINDFTDRHHSWRGTKQSEAKQQHESSNGIETYTGNFKAGNSSMVEAEHPLNMNSLVVVSLTLPEKSKTGFRSICLFS